MKSLCLRLLLVVFWLTVTGCAGSRTTRMSQSVAGPKSVSSANAEATSTVALVSYRGATTVSEAEQIPTPVDSSSDQLAELELLVSNNPTLRRLSQEFRAARSKAQYIDELPDPTIGANFFGHPIETASGSQRSNLTVAQMLPWLPRLDALAQQACLEAAASWQHYQAERLRITSSVRVAWYQLYALQKQIEINMANQELLNTLIDVANARVATGQAAQGDVLAATLEYSKLEEQVVSLRQRLAATKANLNRLLGRDASFEFDVPNSISPSLPDWDHTMLRELAWSHQPDIEAARIRHQASRFGVEVARLRKRPDVTLNASWFAIDDNRPTSTLVNVGEDAWSLGAMMTLPLRHRKYCAIEQEALWKHAASGATVEELRQRYDAILLELWEAAKAANATAELYRDSILPDAKRTLAADQESYINGNVEFDRVIQDFRNLVTLELGYHRSRTELASALARIKQAAGVELID